MAMLAVGMFVITFVRSAVITSNDLAFRSAMIVQFVLLLWAAEFFDRWFFLPHRDRLQQGRWMRFVVHSTLILGVVAAVYGLTILRTYAFLDDKGMIASPADWLPVPHEIGYGIMDIRSAYGELDKVLPTQLIAAIQSDARRLFATARIRQFPISRCVSGLRHGIRRRYREMPSDSGCDCGPFQQAGRHEYSRIVLALVD